MPVKPMSAKSMPAKPMQAMKTTGAGGAARKPAPVEHVEWDEF
jgi:hypothetical protein